MTEVAVLDELSQEQCLELLKHKQVGRIAVVVAGHPAIFPVNYVLDAEFVVFRTDPGTKLTHSSLDRVAFEIDEIDEDAKEGWSVVVQGVGREFTDAVDATSRREQALALRTWVTGEKGHWVRIITPTITGRRIRHVEPS